LLGTFFSPIFAKFPKKSTKYFHKISTKKFPQNFHKKIPQKSAKKSYFAGYSNIFKYIQIIRQ